MVLAVGAALGFGAVAQANGGPHGGYGADTDKCAGCHRAHTAIGAELLVAEDEYALCTSCHDGTGADGNVLEGEYLTDSGIKRLNGGGFETMPMLGYPGDTGGSPVEEVTSTHTVEGLGDSDGVGTAWGSLGASGEGPGVSGTLECSSCHNPHGSTNYRILKDTDSGHGAPPGWWNGGEDGSTDAATCSDTIDNGSADGADLADASGDCQWRYLKSWQNSQVLATGNLIAAGGVDKYATGNYANYTEGMNAFCASCHTEYLTASGSAGTASAAYDAGDGNDAVPRFRHAVMRSASGSADGVLRRAAFDRKTDDGDALSWTDTDLDGAWDPGEALNETPSVNETARSGFTCLTCHFAHGSAAKATGYADDGITADSALLYYDNRGVCRVCHQSTK
jgi:predicted CXXCH cytochrome family protein